VAVVSHQDSESSPPTAAHHQIIAQQQQQQQQQQQLPLQELVQQQQQQQQQQQHRLDEEEDQDDMEDEQMELDQDDSSESGDRIIYPWMKKIHVAGVGECKVVVGPAPFQFHKSVEWFYLPYNCERYVKIVIYICHKFFFTSGFILGQCV
jgi:hypothetical protein